MDEPTIPYFMNLQHRPVRWLYDRGIVLDRSLREWRALRNKFAGQNGFVLGNGPSLRIEDLDRLKGKPAIGSNKLYLAYDQTDFRPTLLTCIDPIVAKNIVDKLRELPGKKYFSHRLAPLLEPMPGAIYWNDQTGATRDPKILRKFSRDAARVIYAGHTVSYNNLQIAFHLGLKTVYLLGMDFRFVVPDTQVEHSYNTAIVSQGERNHFHPDYRKPGEIWTIPQLEHQETAFRSAKLHFEKAGRKIYNASPGSALEVFDRADLDEVLDRW